MDGLRQEIQTLQQEVISLHDQNRRRNERPTPPPQRSVRGTARPTVSSGECLYTVLSFLLNVIDLPLFSVKLISVKIVFVAKVLFSIRCFDILDLRWYFIYT